MKSKRLLTRKAGLDRWFGALEAAQRTGHLGIQTIGLAILVLLVSSEASGQEVPRMELVKEPVFVSADYPDPRVARIGRLDGALFVGPNQVAFVDGVAQVLGFVDIVIKTAWRTQEEEDAELKPRLRLLDRFNGFIVTHRSGSVVGFDTNGKTVWKLAYNPFAEGFVAPKVAGMFPDRQLLFRRSKNPTGFSMAFLAGPEELQRDSVRYETRDAGGATTVLARAMDEEKFFLTTKVDGVTSSGAERIIFGHRLLEARVGEHLMIVQTDRAEAVVYDRAGKQIAGFPLPRDQRQVEPDHIEAQRKLRTLERFRENMARQEQKELSFAEEFGGATFSPGRDSIRIALLPSNDVVPSVDKIIGDLDGRAWLRLFPMPGDTNVYWYVWSVGRHIPDFRVMLPRTKQLLDANGDRVLLRTTDNSGADQFMIHEIVRVK